jgi:putative cardiolipin synthase
VKEAGDAFEDSAKVLPVVVNEFSENVVGNEIGLLASRSIAHKRRMMLIREEQKELRFTSYINGIDVFGEEQIGLSVDAAERGVKLKYAVDGWSAGLPNERALLIAMEELGIDVRVYNPAYRRMPQFNFRNHMKNLIGSNLMLHGGRNSDVHYFARNVDQSFIDMEILVRGDQIKEGAKNYDEVFNSARMMKTSRAGITEEMLVEARQKLQDFKKKSLQIPKYNEKFFANGVTKSKVTDAKYVADTPKGLFLKNPDGLHKEILAMIDRAEDTLEFTNPYVLLTKETNAAVERALKRGVKITINTNSALTQDSKSFGLAWDVEKHRLVKMGIEVNELKAGQYIHAKTIVRDGKEIFVGSFNLDPRSEWINLENGMFIMDDKLAKQLSDHNRRVVKAFMNKVEKLDFKKMSPGAKTRFCIRYGLGQLIMHTIKPLL